MLKKNEINKEFIDEKDYLWKFIDVLRVLFLFLLILELVEPKIYQEPFSSIIGSYSDFFKAETGFFGFLGWLTLPFSFEALDLEIFIVCSFS